AGVGAVARTAPGHPSKEAIEGAYSAMAAAVADVLSRRGLVIAVDAELNRASQIDAILTNESSVEHFHRQVDACSKPLNWVRSTMRRTQASCSGFKSLRPANPLSLEMWLGRSLVSRPINDKRRARGASWSIRSRSTGRLN